MTIDQEFEIIYLEDLLYNTHITKIYISKFNPQSHPLTLFGNSDKWWLTKNLRIIDFENLSDDTRVSYIAKIVILKFNPNSYYRHSLRGEDPMWESPTRNLKLATLKASHTTLFIPISAFDKNWELCPRRESFENPFEGLDLTASASPLITVTTERRKIDWKSKNYNLCWRVSAATPSSEDNSTQYNTSILKNNTCVLK